MKRFIIAAAVAGLFLSTEASIAPATAAPATPGAAQSLAHNDGAIVKADWRREHRRHHERHRRHHEHHRHHGRHEHGRHR